MANLAGESARYIDACSAVKAVKEVEEEEPPLGETSTTSTSRTSEAEKRLLKQLREFGSIVPDRTRECALLGTAAMLERCIAEYHRRSNVGPGWLAQAVREGGQWFNRPSAQRESASDLLRLINGEAS